MHFVRSFNHAFISNAVPESTDVKTPEASTLSNGSEQHSLLSAK